MDKTLYMIGNAHIDHVWLWRWQDGFSEVRASFRSALDRMKEYPGFIFTSASAAYYAWVEENDPAMFEEIRERVKEGRWAIAGGWWVQPDCNIPSGESMARQGLTGQLYFQEKFGKMARTGYNIDSFGHSGSIPKILRMSGMDRYVNMRPGTHEMVIPAPLYTWESPGGESVTTYHVPYDYCSWGKELTAHIERYARDANDDRGLMCFYGVGNHGGGPTKENLDSIERLNGKDGLHLVLSSPDDYFDQALEKGGLLPTYMGDLLHHASGCYSAHSGIKQWNRKAENRLLTAEKWSVLATLLLGKPYPAKELDAAWKRVLLNQFHDILAGTSLIEGYDDAHQDYGYALSVADWHANDAQQALMRQINIPLHEGERPFVAFNPQAFDAKWPVTLDCVAVPENFELVDDTDTPIPYQLYMGSPSLGRFKITFVAEVPALGYRTYRLVPKEGYVHNRPAPQKQNLSLENEWIRAEFSPETGGMTSLLWKPSNTQMLREETRAQIIHDESDTWSHAVLRFDEVIGHMTLIAAERVEEGESCDIIRVTLGYGNSVLIQDYTLYHALPYLYVKTQVNWQEKLKALKLRFATPHNYGHVTSQAPYGYADRPMNGEEHPMQQWVDLSGIPRGEACGASGLAILNDAKYSYDVHDRAIHFTVLRSPYYANHVPFVVEPGMTFPVTDQGWQTFTYVLMPHDETMQHTDVERQAALLNAPIELLPESFHDGEWPQAQGFVNTEGDTHVLLDALKLAEDGSGDLVVHLHEAVRVQADAALTIPHLQQRIPLHFKPAEIKAFRIPAKAGAKAIETDLLERPKDQA